MSVSEKWLFRRFPFVGRFKSIVPDLGYAFIERWPYRGGEEVFAHFTSEYGASDSIPNENIIGADCLFAIAPKSQSDPRPKAVSWCLLNTVIPKYKTKWPDGYEEARFQYLWSANLTSISRWLEADWHVRAVSDLPLSDPLFEQKSTETPKGIEIILTIVQQASMGSSEIISLGKSLDKSPYDLGIYKEWLAEDLIKSDNKLYLLSQSLDELLEVFSPRQLASVFSPPEDAEERIAPEQIVMLLEWSILGGGRSKTLKDKIGTDEMWLSVIENISMGIDLEADDLGAIWQVGSYENHESHIRFDAKNNPDGIALQSAVKHLYSDAKTFSVLVGHNFLKWDLPKLEKIAQGFSKIPAWDTLFVKSLLEPAAVTMALMSTHQAADDAKASVHLFLDQVRKIGAKTVGEALLDGAVTSRDLLELIAPVAERISETPSRPLWVDELLQMARLRPHVRTIVVPNSRLRSLSWLSDICLSFANGETLNSP